MSRYSNKPDTVFETLGKVINISHYTGVVGLTFVSNKYKPFWSQYLWINASVYFLNLIYMALRAYQCKLYDPNVRHFQATYGFVIVGLIEITFYALFIIKSPDLACILNQFQTWFSEFHGKL